MEAINWWNKISQIGENILYRENEKTKIFFCTTKIKYAVYAHAMTKQTTNCHTTFILTIKPAQPSACSYNSSIPNISHQAC